MIQPPPIISFIIPCYNLGHFLRDAIKSCLMVPVSKEIIVVNDGSSDNTSEIARRFPEVIYLEQINKGLPAARNAGLMLASGEYICFLDADDWLIPEHINISLQKLKENMDADLVFGRHIIQHENGRLHIHQPEINRSVYHHLLYSNIIGNPSAVLYRAAIARQFPFSTDTKYKGCEDYQQYVRIALKHKIIHHDRPVCVYRRHSENMSKNRPMMLVSALQVLKDQRKQLIHEEDRAQWKNGINAWLKFYSYFPLRTDGKFHLNKYHWSLAKLLGWKLPLVLIQKWLLKPE